MARINDIFESVDRSVSAMQVRALQNLAASGGGMGGDVANYYGAVATGSATLFFDDAQQQQFPRLYRAAMRDNQYAAIRPIAVKVADQTIRVGRRRVATSRRMEGGFITKQLESIRQTAPEFVVKQIDDANLDPIDTHPIIDLFEGSEVQPNKYMSRWELLYCTAFSIEAVGEAVWWVDLDGDSKSIWYWPRSWIKPIPHNGDAFGMWKVMIPGVPEGFPPIPGKDIIAFRYPNPSDPTRSHSPTQAQSRSINVHDQINDTQLASMRNAMRPSLGIVMGEALATPNGMQRPELTPEQRKQIIEALRLAYRGAMHTGDPIILDGLISDVKQIFASPAELDYVASSAATRDQIDEGYGVNPIVKGRIEGANRASSYVAHEGFYALKVNPICTLISNQLTRRIGPRFASGGEKLIVWLTHPTAFDGDLNIRQVAELSKKDYILPSEARRRLGQAPNPDMEKKLDELFIKRAETAANPPTPPGMGAMGPGQGGGGPPRPAGGGNNRPPKQKKKKRIKTKG